MMSLKDIYFWRQSLVLIGDSLHSVGTGFLLSFSSILNPAILSPNSTDIRATPEEASWISASLGLSGIVGFFIIPPLFQYFGRKSVHLGLNALMALGFLVFYFSISVSDLIIGKSLQGLATCGVTVTVIILAEYSAPKRRGYFMTIKKASASIGALIFHNLYFYLTWRQMALLAVVPYFLSSVFIFFWPESPYYLAMKGKYDECDKAHSWLFGESLKNKSDVNELIEAQMERRSRRKKTVIESSKRLMGKFFRKNFMQPFLIVFLLTLLIEASGRYYMMLYIIQIVVEVTGDSSVAVYCSIVTDVITMVGLAISGYIVRRLSRRCILVYFGLVSTALMYLLSLMIFLQSKNDISLGIWSVPSLIIFNSFVNYVGIVPTSFTVIGEIYPLEHKGLGTFSAGVVFTVLYSITIKLIPMMISDTAVEGMFATFATCMLLSVVGLYFTLIETKDRTLQDIENEIKGVKRCRTELLNKSVRESKHRNDRM